MFASPLVITPPGFVPDEPAAIAALCNRFGCRIHLRKPGADRQTLSDYLHRVTSAVNDPALLTLHYYTDGALLSQCGGFHAASLPAGLPAGKLLSRPLHSLGELDDPANDAADYVLLSPVFDSISKTGYRAGFDHQALARHLHAHRYPFGIVALGGIGSGNIGRARAMGFDGAALLGTLWSAYRDGNDIPALVKTYEKTELAWKKE